MIMATMFHLNLIPYKFTAYRLYNGIISASEVSVILKASAIFISTRKAQELIDENSLLIIVDTHSLKFLESSDLYSMSKQTMIIDHHRLTVDKIDNTVIFFHEPFASSTCEMVTELSQYMGENLIDKPVSECLFAGIMLDTKNF